MFVLDLLAKIGTSPALAQHLSRLSRLPDARLALLVQLFRSLPDRDLSKRVSSGLLTNIADNPNALDWLMRLVEQLNDQALRGVFHNMLVNEMVQGQQVRRRFLQQEGFEPPVTLVINPTMACNLKCEGCYSYKMPRKGMDYALLARVLREAWELGTRFITVSGGEPLLYRHLFRMAEEFHNMTFLTYTNGTLIDDAMADRIAGVGNVLPAISVEGFEQHTDARRGAGVHRQALEAMERLRRRGVLFGFSATPTRETADVIATDAFLDYYLERGALFGWMFQYLPVGKDPDPSLMATPEQRNRVRAHTKRWQVSRPIYIGDFWNDGACVGECLSASRYCYITPEGLVQPCTFVHFYTHDINSCTLKDVLRSDFFRAIRAAKPYTGTDNLLRPCKVIDAPEQLRRLVRECGAKPSYPGAETILEDSAVRAHLDAYAREWAAISEREWNGPDYNGGRSVVVPFLGRIDVHERFYSVRTSREQRARAEQRGGVAREVACPSRGGRPGKRAR